MAELDTVPQTSPALSYDEAQNQGVMAPYDPMPEAINTFNKVVGNSTTGTPSNSGVSSSDSFEKNMQNINAYGKASTELANKPAESDPINVMKAVSFNGDYDGANYERYYHSAPFKQLGFNPYRDNESLYNNHMSSGDEFVRAATQWVPLAVTGVMSGIRSIPTSTDMLAPDLKSNEEMQRYMGIGSATKSPTSSFLINTFLNSAYTVGIGAEMLGETLALAGATAVTSGADLEATLPTWMTRMTGAASKLGKAATAEESIAEAAKAGKTIGELKSFWDGATGKVLGKIGESINPLENTWNLGKDIKSGENAAKFTDKAAGTINKFAQYSSNFGEFAKDLIQIKAAVSEAKLEGGGVQSSTTTAMIQKYKDDHDGKEPEGKDLAEIENIAHHEAKVDAFWNLPAIMWSNKFMYHTIFAPFEKGAVKGLEGAVQAGEDILLKKGVTATGADASKFVISKEGLLGKLENLRINAKDPKAWRAYGYNYLKENAAEGIQENLQQILSDGAQTHAMSTYNNPDRGSYEAYMGHYLTELKNQFTATGAQTFAGGFIMASMAHPFMSVPMWAGKSVLNNTINKKNYTEYKTNRDTQQAADAKSLNETYQDPIKYYAPDLSNAVKQGHLNDDLYQANIDNNKKNSEDIRSTSLYDHMYTALSLGKSDIMIDKMKTMRDFTPEQAAQALVGPNATAAEGTKALELLEKAITRAETIKENYNDVSNSHPNPYNPAKYNKYLPVVNGKINKDYKESRGDLNDKGAIQYQAEAISYKAWEEARKNLIFAKTEFENHGERIRQIAETLTGARNPVKNTNSQDLMVLLDRNQMVGTLKALRDTIKLSDKTTPEGRKLSAESTKKFDLLKELHDGFKLQSGRMLESARKVSNDKLRTTFGKYLDHISKSTGDHIFNDKVDHAFKMIQDNNTLEDERGSLVRSINVLNNPKGFLALHKDLITTFTDMHNSMIKDVATRQKEFSDATQTNNTATELFKRTGMYITPEYIKYLKDALEKNEVIELPKSYVDSKDPDFKQIFDRSNPNFIKAEAVMDSIIKAIQATHTEVPNAEKGKIIYATTGSGKSEWIKNHPDEKYKDADDLLIAEIQKQVPEFKIDPKATPQQTLWDFSNLVPVDKRGEVYQAVRDQMTILKNQGTSILTGTADFIKNSDEVYLQSNNRLLSNKGLSDEQIDHLRAREQSELAKSGKPSTRIAGYIGDVLNQRVAPVKVAPVKVAPEVVTPYATTVEGKIAEQQTEVTSIESTLADNNKRIRGLQQSLSNTTNEIAERASFLINSIKTFKDKIDNKEGNLDYNKNRLGKLQSEYNSLFSTANDLKNNIRDIKSQISQLEGIRNDLLNSIQYYTDMVLANPKLTLQDVENKKVKLQAKITTIEHLIQKLKELINSSLETLKDIANIIADRFKLLTSFEKGHSYFIGLKKGNRIGELLSLEKQGTLNKPGQAMLLDYADLNKQHNELENLVTEAFEHGDIADAAVKEENKKLTVLQGTLDKYSRQLRYLDGILTIEQEDNKENPIEPVKEKEVPPTAVTAVKTTEVKAKVEVPIVPEVKPVITPEPVVSKKADYTVLSLTYDFIDKSDVKGEHVTFKNLPEGIHDQYFAYKDGDTYKIGAYDTLGTKGEGDIGQNLLGSSKLSMEDAIQKGYDTLTNTKEEEVSAHIIETQLNSIRNINKIGDFNTLYDKVVQVMSTESTDATNFVLDKLDKKEAELLKTYTSENLNSAKKVGYNIIFNGSKDTVIPSGIYSNFTAHENGDVTITSLLGTAEHLIDKVNLDEQLGGLTKKSVPDQIDISDIDKKDTNEAIKHNSTISSAESALKLKDEAKNTTVENANKAEDDAVGCE